MSYFPVMIKLNGVSPLVKVDYPESLPTGVPFTIISTSQEKPKIGEIWELDDGTLATIIHCPLYPDSMALLFYDCGNYRWTTIHFQAKKRREMTLNEFFQAAMS